MKKAIGISIMMIVVLVNACKHDSLIPGGTPPPGITPPAVGSSIICFETNVLPIFVSNCAKPGCHNSISQVRGLRFDNYQEIMKSIKPNDPNDSKAWKLIIELKEDKRMPPLPAPALTKAQKDSIYKWIVQGAQNTVNCNMGCDTTFFTYSGAIFPILQATCIGCHSGPTPTGGLDFTVYNNVRTVALNGILKGVINHEPGFPQMPRGGNKLPDCKIKQIENWIRAGAPNN